MTTAQWFLSLDTHCPACETAFDLLAEYPEFFTTFGVFAGEARTENSCGVEVACPHCKHEFTVDLDY
jgi:phage FluMu protein Com